jgi:hypothetical protein
MFVRACLCLTLFSAVPAWSQVTASAVEYTANSADETLMQTPPPVSSETYPTEVGVETRSNYLHAGVSLSTAYNDNVLAGSGATPISATSYTIWPTIALDMTTSRFHQTLTYSPGFTFYHGKDAQNESDQNLDFDLQYRLSPHVTASFRDTFRKSSNAFNQPYLLSGGAVSGSTQSSITAIVVPAVDQINNIADAELTYQFAMNDMIGGSGNFTNLDYPNAATVPGLYNSSYRGGSVFYSHRLSNTVYLGETFQYSETIGSSPSGQNNAQSETRSQTFLSFCTIYLKPNLSFSISGGPQRFVFTQSSLPTSESWAPTITASIGWQERHTSFAASYTQAVSGGGGLLGTYHSDSGNLSARWQIARTWTIGSQASYAITNNVSSSMSQANPGGYGVSATFSAQHPINQHFNMEFGYTRIHQSYSSVAAISNAPDSNREYVSIVYQFSRPLGR